MSDGAADIPDAREIAPLAAIPICDPEFSAVIDPSMTNEPALSLANSPNAPGYQPADDGDALSPDREALTHAARAVRQEFHESARQKTLRCRRVDLMAERGQGVLAVLSTGTSIDFDWTWEGATAVAFAESSTGGPPTVLWSGEILEADEEQGRLFILPDDEEQLPQVGRFVVRPYEFLAVLDRIYNEAAGDCYRERLLARLALASGRCRVAENKKSGSSSERQGSFTAAWGILWGPPGTGKTYTSGRRVAELLTDPDERILVVSTTNRATDAIAVSIGRALLETEDQKECRGRVVRIGRGAAQKTFEEAGCGWMTEAGEDAGLRAATSLQQQLPGIDLADERAFIRKRIADLKQSASSPSERIFSDPEVRVVIATAFRATAFLERETVRRTAEAGCAPFSTIVIDEAGLISRVAAAALSLLAARRVVLVGDSRQLAPISRISRLLPGRRQTWLANSGLSHLERLDDLPSGVELLSEQRRMHPDICRVVSDYQYQGRLTTAEDRMASPSDLPEALRQFSRTIWYVLDDEDVSLASVRASRGPGNRSWVRSGTTRVLTRLLVDQGLADVQGLFISPYKAQAGLIRSVLAAQQTGCWESSTVHSQQGSEADVVIFDTVCAGSYHWPVEEWRRLINVALSRAREAVIVLATRSEMNEPYLRPLRYLLAPAVLRRIRGVTRWQRVPATDGGVPEHLAEERSHYEVSGNGAVTTHRALMGSQMESRRTLKPVLSEEQQRLCGLEPDGKPRLVRGVAGSGKSAVLCHWLARVVSRRGDSEDLPVWVVYANRSLHRLLQEAAESAWTDLHGSGLFAGEPFPWEIVRLLHVRDVLGTILGTCGLDADAYGFDYDAAAGAVLRHEASDEFPVACRALFIDEAQDMGPNVLQLLLALVEQNDPQDRNSRSAHIFYDNAQNLYGTRTPRWSQFGIDVRGRSTILRESFRSTRPVTELAVNVLARLLPASERKDQQELLSMGLLQQRSLPSGEWLQVKFNQIGGPNPIFCCEPSRAAEMERILQHLTALIQQEQIRPAQICMICNGRATELVRDFLQAPLATRGIELSFQTSRPFERRPNTVIVTTANSFKGYEAEVVIIPCADCFIGKGGVILAHSLYVAMTRARSLLAVYSTVGGSDPASKLNGVIGQCTEMVSRLPALDLPATAEDDQEDILLLIGNEHRGWLRKLWKKYEIRQDPLSERSAGAGQQPLLHFSGADGRTCILLPQPVSDVEQQSWENAGFVCLHPGASID